MDMKKVELPDKGLTNEIIGAAIAVHKALGPGFLESIYEEALCIQLTHQNIPFERQKIIRLTYLDQPIGEHRLDLLVSKRVVVELKELFTGFRSGLVFVTAFETRADMGRFLNQISWETEVWIAEDADHVVHFNGERFLGPYPDTFLPERPASHISSCRSGWRLPSEARPL